MPKLTVTDGDKNIEFVAQRKAVIGFLLYLSYFMSDRQISEKSLCDFFAARAKKSVQHLRLSDFSAQVLTAFILQPMLPGAAVGGRRRTLRRSTATRLVNTFTGLGGEVKARVLADICEHKNHLLCIARVQVLERIFSSLGGSVSGPIRPQAWTSTRRF